MKCQPRWSLLILAILFVNSSSAHVHAQEGQKDAQRNALEARFKSLQRYFVNALEKVDGAITKSGTEMGGEVLNGQLQIERDALDEEGESLSAIEVKLWARLAVKGDDGQWMPCEQHVNLQAFKWSPGQSFYLCLEPAVPIQLGLFQILKNETKQISPDVRFPKTFATIMPGKIWQSPRLVLDDDAEDELLSVIVVRADTRCLPINGALNPSVIVRTSTTVISSSNQANAVSTARVESCESLPSEALEQTSNALDGLAKLVYSKTKGDDEVARSLMKMEYAPPVGNTRGNTKDDVALLAIGLGGVGHIQLVFKKDLSVP